MEKKKKGREEFLYVQCDGFYGSGSGLGSGFGFTSFSS